MNRLEEGALGNPVLAGKPRSSAPMVLCWPLEIG
jgi:hypothetical protein